MTVNVNAQVTNWMSAQAPVQKSTYNTKCSEASNNDLSSWRNVGKGIWDYRVSGNYRCVAVKTGGVAASAGDSFEVKAIYSHLENGGKKLETGQAVPDYNKKTK